MMKDKISFTVTDNNSKQVIETYDGEYRNLMFLLKDKIYLDYFGECGGMGRCATCVVRINGMTGKSTIKERNEPTTLDRVKYSEFEHIRLSCQIMVTNDLHDTIVEIMEL